VWKYVLRSMMSSNGFPLPCEEASAILAEHRRGESQGSSRMRVCRRRIWG
jgi:hypothetical protein